MSTQHTPDDPDGNQINQVHFHQVDFMKDIPDKITLLKPELLSSMNMAIDKNLKP